MSLRPKKLMALDSEDLEVVSAHCQDSVLKVSDIDFLARENRFILAMNRFVWENGERQNVRTKSILHFERVTNVATRNIDLKNKETVLSLLAVIFTATDTPAGNIDLVFSADAAIRLSVECIEAQLADMDVVWEASSKPRHNDS